jgi:plastocyanin domain-containing protein
MTNSEIVVAVTAVAAIVWVNWYFFFAQRAVAVASTARGAQEVVIAVKGGYEPAMVRVKRGAPVRLVFDRQEKSGCSEEVVFPAFGVKRFLPAFERTTIELTPEEAGTYEFTCGMGMLRGKLVVE